MNQLAMALPFAGHGATGVTLTDVAKAVQLQLLLYQLNTVKLQAVPVCCSC